MILHLSCTLLAKSYFAHAGSSLGLSVHRYAVPSQAQQRAEMCWHHAASRSRPIWGCHCKSLLQENVEFSGGQLCRMEVKALHVPALHGWILLDFGCWLDPASSCLAAPKQKKWEAKVVLLLPGCDPLFNAKTACSYCCAVLPLPIHCI